MVAQRSKKYLVEAQNKEFAALGYLNLTYNKLQDCVDIDDYPRMKGEYEVALAKFIVALAVNGRL